ncbi:DUF6161 domain-containing protein [Bradyrhizobium sp. 956_D2_N1_5]|uniref:DUF6161 domain-containing protein n=1 Tax=unclassified Bradyrhizobium TaxID=2631580 RepID=UPI003F26CA01
MIAFPYQLSIPSQGVSLNIPDAAALETFLREESSYFAELGSLLSGNINMANTNYGNPQIQEGASRAFDEMLREIKGGEFQSFENYVTSARELRVLIGRGQAGQQIKVLSKGNNGSLQQQARWMAYIFCADWSVNNAADQLLSPFRAAFAANPLTQAYGDLISTTEAMRQASTAVEVSENAKRELEEFIQEKTEVFGRLEQLYRTKLTLDEPALTWKKIAERKTKVWGVWLIVFACLVAGPLLLTVAFWPSISKNVHELTVGANGAFSIAGLATITVPALLYAWLLKNVSRIFIQNLNLADDAAHRQSLALTYMGLLQDEKHPASDQDRAIILNALFRPIPPQTADEGPPSGVIDLIRNK